MSGLLIPDDWNEQTDGYCTMSLTVPNSSLWRANVRGAIQALSLERAWDAQTGDPAQAAQVGKDIYESIQYVCDALIQPDDFNDLTLSPFWTHVPGDPGDPVPTLTGTEVSITVPAGISHDPYPYNITSWIKQSCGDVDFELEVKFNSGVLDQYQEQGVIVEGDNVDHFIRFDFYSDGTNTNIFSAILQSGDGNNQVNSIIAAGGVSPLWLRVKRVGDQFTQSYSLNGQDFIQVADFTHAMTVTAVGVFAGNFADTPGNEPAHTALIDYFHVL